MFTSTASTLVRVFVGRGRICADIGPVPVESQSPPANVLYEVADFTQGTRYEDASIDMVQARQIILGVRSVC
jgi:hypothetical protein